MANDGPPSDGVADRTEDLVFGRGKRWYRWFVRAVVGFLLVVLLADLVWVVADALGTPLFSPAVVDGLEALTAAALTLFLLTGLLQFLVIGRAAERGTEEVTESAEELERTAEEVAEAAAEVEKLTDTVATQSEPDEEVAENVKKQTEEIKGEMAGAERTAGDVKETLDQQRERGPDEGDEGDERADDDG